MPSQSVSTSNRLQVALLPMYSFAWRLVLLLFVARTALVSWQWDRVMAADMFATVFMQGLRFDLVVLGLALVPPIFSFPLLASTRHTSRLWQAFLRFYFPIVLVVVLFLELSTPSFINQFDSRPNLLFVEYLGHPREVALTLWAAYKLPLVIALTVLVVLAAALTRQFRAIVSRTPAAGIGPSLLLFPVLLIACVGLVRSTLDHRPVNPSTVALSSDPLVNDLALNSAYTVLYAIYETRHEDNGGIRYSNIPDKEAVNVIREEMRVAPGDFTSTEFPTMHVQHFKVRDNRPKNLVIIIEESLGAEFVGALGGLPLTPNLDALSNEGIWFENLYATGTRSVRGLEAIISGYPPTPARSVVKLPKSQRGFFTLAGLFGEHGYQTSFIYGGEAQFDNMRRFFVNNGFEQVIDEKDYISPAFVGSWGVSDEDLFNRAHEEFSSIRDKPFFSVVFTSSNHSPYQFPDGRIELFDRDKSTVSNAVKYADFALGRFFDLAKQSGYWDDTVFLVVADHNSRVYGEEIVPVERFHIPALILGGSIGPQHLATVASQIDLGPTLLPLVGLEGEHPMIGHDLMTVVNRNTPGRAIMQFNTTQAYMEDDKVIVLQRDQSAQQFRYVDGHLVVEPEIDAALSKKALAHSVWSSLAYQRSLYPSGPKDFPSG